MIRYRNNYRVKFVNNKSYWYWCDEDCRIGDLVYCTGSQEGILGKIIEINDREFANQKIIKVTGHIQLENTDEIEELWESLESDQRNMVMDALGQKEPYSKTKFINVISNFWTLKGSEGMNWEDYLSFIISYSESWKPESTEPDTYDDCISQDGFLWRAADDIPNAERIDRDLLTNGVLYGTAAMITKLKEKYKLKDIVEFTPGIFRTVFDDVNIMADYPELKVAFFYVTRNSAYAVYSESGYPYLTKEVYTPVKMDHRDGYSYLSHYYPDEVFRETSSSYDPESFDVRFNSPFDKEFRELNYVVRRDGVRYQMAGIDRDHPPHTKNKDWVYTIDYGEAVIHRYRGNCRELIFPEELEGKKVKGIADRFAKEDSSYQKIHRIVIPEGYRYIGAYAFAGCKNLTEVTLPSTVTTIGDGAFLKCAKLKEITLPDSLCQIWHNYDEKDGGRFMFKGCTSLRTAYIPEHLSYIDGHPFESWTKVCTKLKHFDHLLIHRCFIDQRSKEMKEENTYQIFANAELMIHHNKKENRIELFTPPKQYAGCFVEEKGYDYDPISDFDQYPDRKQIRIIAVKGTNDIYVSEVEIVFK